MDWQLISHYVVAIMISPVLFIVLRKVIKNRSTLFDDDLTTIDRTLLKQFALFLLLPAVALFHEIGHALTAKMLGVNIIAFHWSLFFGQVDVSSDLSNWQNFVIALSGNIFQLAVTLAALAVALCSRSPAVVALSVYLYLFSGFSGLIFYPALSLIGWNCDFAIIYGTDDKSLSLTTGAAHLVLAAAFAWTFLSHRARLWFARKTRPIWAKEYDKVAARVKADASAVNLLSQAWQFYFVGLDKSAEVVLDKVEDTDKKLMEVWLLRGYLHQSKGRYKSAVLCFEQITNKPQENDSKLLARAWMARGHCLTDQIETAEGKEGKKDYQPVLMSYKQACNADGHMADPHYYLGVALTKAGQIKDAESELEICQNYTKRGLSWLDPILSSMVRDALAETRQIAKPKP